MTTRTLLTEIDIPNPDDALPPGVYCTVELKIPRKAPSFIVPAEAIIFNRNGPPRFLSSLRISFTAATLSIRSLRCMGGSRTTPSLTAPEP